MTQTQRTIAALVVLFFVAGTSYAFLEWQKGRPAADPVITVATTTPETPADPEDEPKEDTTPGVTASNHSFGRVVLRLNEIATFPNGLVVHPLAVVEDSRCPENARCIQAGTVRLSVRIVSGSGESNNVIGLGKTITTEAEEITFAGVSPGKLTSTTITDADYRFGFEVKQRVVEAKRCYVGGCSAQLCTDDPAAVSTCEYRAEYACYKTAKCERQSTGQCGWTETDELRSCLRNPPEIE